MTTVAVIGAGPLGLASVKNFSEAGFDVTGFEARDHLGGLWKYSTDSSLSCQETTIFNSSRFRSAFTDFPFSDDVDDFPTWQQLYKYVNAYADHFDIRKKVQLNSRVEHIDREGDKWVIRVKSKDGKVRTERFDKVAIANGYFTAPKQPKLQDVDKFEGKQLHAINFHHPEQYAGKNVLLIGLHATSADVTTMLHGHAKKVYLSHRNGLYIMSRYGSDHKPMDVPSTMQVSKVLLFLMKNLPSFYEYIFDKLVSSMSKKSFPNLPASWNFYPAPPASVTNPLVADELYRLMESGFATPVAEVRRFTGAKSVELTDGTVLEDIDAVVYCTGYDASVPFVAKEYDPYPQPGKQGNMYRNLFLLHPDKAVRESICFIGHGGILWPGLSLFELQSAAVAQIWAGKSQLPSYEDQKKWLDGLMAYRKRLYAKNPSESTMYTALIPTADHIAWLDEVCGCDVLSRFGFSWKAWKFWWQDRDLYNLLNTGVLDPSIWRLFDTGKRKQWDVAKDQIVLANKLLERSVARRKSIVEAEQKKLA